MGRKSVFSFENLLLWGKSGFLVAIKIFLNFSIDCPRSLQFKLLQEGFLFALYSYFTTIWRTPPLLYTYFLFQNPQLLISLFQYRSSEILDIHKNKLLSESYSLRSSPSEMFWAKNVLKICSKFRGEQRCRSRISIKLQVCCIFSEYPFIKAPV